MGPPGPAGKRGFPGDKGGLGTLLISISDSPKDFFFVRNEISIKILQFIYSLVFSIFGPNIHTKRPNKQMILWIPIIT